MRKLLVFPTWIILVMSRSALPRHHIWHNEVPNLQSWTDGASDLCVMFGTGMWVSTIGFVASLIILYLRS